MIGGLLWLLGCQLAGEVIVRVLGVTVPGPVVGMVLLLVVLRWRRVPTATQESLAEPDADPVAEPASPWTGLLTVADTLLRHLQLLFVPAGVGVVAYAGVLRSQALPLGVALVVSWALGLAAVGGLVTVFVHRSVRRAARRAAS